MPRQFNRYNIKTLVDPRLVSAAMEGNHGNRAWAERTIRDCETAIARVHDEMGPNNNVEAITSISGSSGEKVQKMVELHSELTAAQDVMRNIELLGVNGDSLYGAPAMGDMLANNNDFVRRVESAGPGSSVQQNVEMFRINDARAAVDRSDFVPAEYQRGGVIQVAMLRQYSVLRTLNGTVTVPRGAEGGTIRHKREVPQSNPAPRAEGAKATNMAPTLTNIDAKLESIAATVNGITDEVTDDYPGTIRIIGSLAARQAINILEKQVAGGNGTSPQLDGANTQSGFTSQKHVRVDGNTDRSPKDPMTDIRKAMTTVWSKGEVPSAVWIDPAIWERIQTERQDDDGAFIYGPPIDSPQNRIWGLDIGLSTDVSDNIAAFAANEDWCVVGPFSTGCDLFMKRQATFELGWVTGDFASFQRTGRVNLRAAMVWYRPDAFVRIGSGGD